MHKEESNLQHGVRLQPATATAFAKWEPSLYLLTNVYSAPAQCRPPPAPPPQRRCPAIPERQARQRYRPASILHPALWMFTRPDRRNHCKRLSFLDNTSGLLRQCYCQRRYYRQSLSKQRWLRPGINQQCPYRKLYFPDRR